MKTTEEILSKKYNKLYKHNKILAMQVGITIESFKILLEIGDKLSKEISAKTLEELELIEYEDMS